MVFINTCIDYGEFFAAKRAGMEVEFKGIDWASKEAELKSKHIDALWNGLTVTPEREKNILFSNPYYNDKEYIVVRADDNSITDKASLAGKVVAVQQASTGERAIDAEFSLISPYSIAILIRSATSIRRTDL